MAEVKIETERIDDVPLLMHQQQKMGIPEVLNQVIQPHGNRQGLSVGWLTTAWLSYILSEADHRMSEVEPWAEDQIQTLSALLPEPVRAKDFTDDRLADVLRWLGDDEAWEEVETQLGQRLIRVYDLKRCPARLDSTTVMVYHDSEGNTLFRHGPSKDHRPDWPQFKVMLAALDPLGMPLAKKPRLRMTCWPWAMRYPALRRPRWTANGWSGKNASWWSTRSRWPSTLGEVWLSGWSARRRSCGL